ncbi:MFS general substrate transporter [Viridothelium virens]|uniref:MFS general substrate transporter n=1 Tax=Viridothelium virens TaxID=1048519 RepID=A0A6A6H966_VIRVR|nr:MFS general substrate transporter [Viridothelium virens]
MTSSHYLPPSLVPERADSQSTRSHDTPSYAEKNQYSINDQDESSNRLHPVRSLQQEVKELREDINNTVGPGEALRRAVTGQSTASVKDPGPPPDGGVLAWTQAIMAHLVIFNTWGYIASFGVFQTYYTTTLGHPASDISWVGSVQIFLLFFIGTFSGRAIDGGLFHHVFIAGFIIQLIGVFMTSLSTKYWQLFLAQGVCTGLANGLQFCPTMSLVSTYFSKKRAFAMGVAATGSATGGLVFPAIVRSLLPQIGFAWTVRVLGLVMLVLGALYTATLRTRLPPRKSGPLVEWSAFREPTYVLSVFGIFLAFWSLYFAFYYVGAYGRNIIGIPYEESISLLLIMNGVGIPARLIPNFFADRTFGPLNMVIPYCFLTGCVFFAWSGVHSRGGVYAFACAYGLVSAGIQSLFPPTLTSLTTDLTKTGVRLGMGFTIVSFACLTGPPLAGALIQDDDGQYLYAQMWAGSTMVCGGCLLVAARIVKTGFVLKQKI